MRIILSAAALTLVVSCTGAEGESSTTAADVTSTGAGPTSTFVDSTTVPVPDPTTTTTFDGPSGEIVISGFSFGSNQTVAVGTRVTATNRDPFGHTWTSTDQIWDSGTLSEGESFSFTFVAPGTFSFFCKIHATEMGGSIIIEG
jgi:plastocyanin